jgi:hypothetical protein
MSALGQKWTQKPTRNHTHILASHFVQCCLVHAPTKNRDRGGSLERSLLRSYVRFGSKVDTKADKEPHAHSG